MALRLMAVNVILLLMFAYETFSHSRRISWLPASLISILTGIAIAALTQGHRRRSRAPPAARQNLT